MQLRGAALWMLASATAVADPRPKTVATASPVEPVDSEPASLVAPTESRPNAIYFEGFGKGGVYGLGYERTLRVGGRRVGLGAVGSATLLDGQQLYTLTPYLNVAPLRKGPHALFVDVGAQLAGIWTPSPVPEWDGAWDAGVGGELSVGYEYRARALVRVYGEAIAGKGGIAPWFGVAIGWTL